MKMKKIFSYLAMLSLLVSFYSCEKEEVMTFEGDRGINFVIYESAYDSYTDDYKNLESEHNFFTDYALGTSMELADFQVEVGVQLEGTYSDTPIKVKVKAENVEGYEPVEVVLPEEIVIEPGEYRAHFSVSCKQPKAYNKEFKTKLVFDYSNSDVIAGSKERQEYVITVSDEASWEDMYVEDLEEWNLRFSPYLGTAGDVKIRFIYTALKTINYHYNWTNSLYYYIVMGRPSWAFTSREMDCLRTQLDSYNASHDTPLKELDGTLVTFPAE